MPFKADKSNVPTEMLRWSLFKAAREFGTVEATLGKKLGEVGELPGPDECFSSWQILRALYGEVYQERLRLMREAADGQALKNVVLRGDYIFRVELEKIFSEVANGILQIIKASSLTKEEQNDLSRAISSIPVMIKDTAKVQARAGLNGAEKKKRGRPRKVKADEAAAKAQAPAE